ncbi:UNC93-like protein [Armadillidium nasatum]|uniref:UNC93-like protein n=1 Tax=Armadillidium nasatum TaxID=96803 RepID=A0A5N5T6T7_9CRUS|nr:UNC93-like protein [Armadillidium nasatum]
MAVDNNHPPEELQLFKDENQVKKEMQEASKTSLGKIEIQSQLSMDEKKKLKWSILKNVFCISFAFTLLFTSFNSMSNLQSSLYSIETLDLSVDINHVNSVLGSSVFFVQVKNQDTSVSNLQVSLYRLLWSFGVESYHHIMLIQYQNFILILKIMLKKTMLDLQSYKKSPSFASFVFPELLHVHSSSLISRPCRSTVMGVQMHLFVQKFLASCGANFCPNYDLSLEDPDSEETPDSNTFNNASEQTQKMPEIPSELQNKIYIMASIYIVLALCAVSFVGFLVNPLSRYGINMNEDNKTDLEIFLTRTAYPSIYLAYVTCAIGVHMVGYVYLCYGISDAIFSYGFTPLMKYTKRLPIFTFGFLLDLALMITLLLWQPHPDKYIVFFVIPALWGMADAVWQTQINAFYGVIFSDSAEAAFSNYRLWESFGFIIAYVMGGTLCIKAKLIINITFLIIGISGYYLIELKFIKSRIF